MPIFDKPITETGTGKGVYNKLNLGALSQGMCTSDFDGDGDQDIAMAYLDYPTGEILTAIRLWENVSGSFVPRDTPITNNNILSFPGKVFSADFNLDGKLDIYIGTFGNETTSPSGLHAQDVVLLNDGNFNFSVDQSTNFPYSWAHGSKLGDLNNDGKVDIFSSGMVGWPSYFFINDNPWRVVETNLTGKSTEVRNNIEDSFVTDIDLDGYSDLIIGTWSQNTQSNFSDVKLYPAQVYWGTKDGIGVNHTDLPFSSIVSPWDTTTFASAVGDINNDGLLDIVLANTNDGSVVKDGQFYPEWVADSNGFPRAATASVNAIQILINNGNRTFTDTTSNIHHFDFGNKNPFFNLRLIDFNQDGFLDIYGGVLQHKSGDQPFILLNDGKGGFVGESIDESLSIPFPCDVNNDGLMDICAIEGRWEGNSQGYDVVKTLFNTGTRENIFYGSAEDDQISLARGSSYYGNAGNDIVFGSNENDFIAGGIGMDKIDGGGLLDFAIYSQAISKYKISNSKDIVNVSSLSEGSDSLVNIERLRFSDTNVALDTDKAESAGEAYRLYKAAFDRTPDKEGLGYWINAFDHGADLTGVASSFIVSPEFAAMYGANSTDTNFVALLYNHVLHRNPDVEGNAYWLNALQHGMTRGAVLASFSESPENIAQTAQLIANGIQYQEWVA